MSDIPASFLPGPSQPWARAMEEKAGSNESRIQQLESQLANANDTISTLSSQNQAMQGYIRTICQIAGYSYPPAQTPPTPPPAVVVPPTSQSVTKDFGADWSATWYQSFKRTSVGGTNDDRQSLYQRGSGYTFSMWHFNIGEAAGKNITAAQMYLSNISTYNNGPFVAFLGTHGVAAEPASRQGRQNAFDVGWTAGEGKWISLPAGFLTGISNGSIQGFTMGDETRETRNFARFNGVGRAGAPVLRLTYTV